MRQEWNLAGCPAWAGIGLLIAGMLASCAPHAKQKGKDPNRPRAQSATGDTKSRTAASRANRTPAELFRADGNQYRWTSRYDPAQALANRIAPPEDYSRPAAAPGTFAHWLRGLPLKPGRPDVMLHNGQPKGNQEAHHAVVDMDVGTKDLQQCADAIMRLRAEYLFATGRAGEIRFRTGTGLWLEWARWQSGDRPVFEGPGSWRRSSSADSSHRNFRAYLDVVFAYVGTASLAPQLQAVRDVRQMQIGDVFIKPGSPGHAVLVVDMAEREGDKVFLLAQSYMPAQEVHVLRNPDDPERSPWYDLDFGDELQTPEWKFPAGTLKRFGP